jgi:beta-glucosidase
LAQALIKTGKPVVIILNEGRPRIINKIEPGAAAILDIYLPGNFGADALADILTGAVNPSGKLPLTYPRYVNDLAVYMHKPSEGSGNPQGGETNPQYPFGFGLSYTGFSYSNLTTNKNSFDPNETATISITVTNTGNRQGKEVVQLFISDLIASLTPDVKRLRGFQKVDLKAGESKTVTFQIPLKQLAFVGIDLKKHLEAGDFNIRIGDQQKEFSVNKTLVF